MKKLFEEEEGNADFKQKKTSTLLNRINERMVS